MWAAEMKAKIDIPLGNQVIKAGDTITVTRGEREAYILWHSSSIWDLPHRYVGDFIRTISEK